MSETPPGKRKARKKTTTSDIAERLAAPSAEPVSVAKTLGMTVAQLALKSHSEESQKALDALHELFSACAELGVARTRVEAASQLERLVREAATLEATPDQVRRLLIDVLKLADQRPKRVARASVEGASNDAAPLTEKEQAVLRRALEHMAVAPKEPSDDTDEDQL